MTPPRCPLKFPKLPWNAPETYSNLLNRFWSLKISWNALNPTGAHLKAPEMPLGMSLNPVQTTGMHWNPRQCPLNPRNPIEIPWYFLECPWNPIDNSRNCCSPLERTSNLLKLPGIPSEPHETTWNSLEPSWNPHGIKFQLLLTFMNLDYCILWRKIGGTWKFYNNWYFNTVNLWNASGISVNSIQTSWNIPETPWNTLGPPWNLQETPAWLGGSKKKLAVMPTIKVMHVVQQFDHRCIKKCGKTIIYIG